MKQLVQRAQGDWLSLRRPADHAARHTTLDAVGRLSQHLAPQLDGSAAISVLDLGAGTGSNLAWLGTRLDVPQAWTLIDRDAGLLRKDSTPAAAHVVGIQRVHAELDDPIVAQLFDGSRTLVTCSALLDVMTTHQVESLTRLIASQGACALLSLTVTGEVDIAPAMDLDQSINDTFNAHQRRHTLAGPGATTVARRVLSAAGYHVQLIGTPWTLTVRQSALMERYLTDRIASVVDQEPALEDPCRAWLATRLGQMEEGRLTVRVGHEDLMAFPPP